MADEPNDPPKPTREKASFVRISENDELTARNGIIEVVNNPPIGTAQNAADVARKAELEAHEKALFASQSGDVEAYQDETQAWARLFAARVMSKAPTQALAHVLQETVNAAMAEDFALRNDDWVAVLLALIRETRIARS